MVRLITLNGQFNGSAVLNMEGDATKIQLTLRGSHQRGELTAHLVSGDRVVPVKLLNGIGKGNISNVCGVIIADEDGSFISEGVRGMHPSELKKARENIRMANRKMNDTKASMQRRNSSTLPDSNSVAMGNSLKPCADETGIGRSAVRASKPNSAKPNHDRKSAIPDGSISDGASGRNQGSNRDKVSGTPNAMGKSANAPNAGLLQNAGNSKDNPTDISGSMRRGSTGERALSSVTAGILDKAKELFHYVDSGVNPSQSNDGRFHGNHSNDFDKKATQESTTSYSTAGIEIPICDNCASCDEEAVMNPFPQLFPNSYWKRKIGDQCRIVGTAEVRGVRYSITAVRSSGKNPPRGLGGNLRRVRSQDGKLFWLGIVKFIPNNNH